MLGFSILAYSVFSAVPTVSVLPITPVSAANPAYSSSWLTPSAAALPVAFWIPSASSGIVVCPNRMVSKVRSATFCTASSLVSP